MKERYSFFVFYLGASFSKNNKFHVFLCCVVDD